MEVDFQAREEGEVAGFERRRVVDIVVASVDAARSSLASCLEKKGSVIKKRMNKVQTMQIEIDSKKRYQT